MKKTVHSIILILVGISLFLSFTSCKANDTIFLEESKSYFSDFQVEGNQVKIKCYITLTNNFDVEKTVHLSAKLPEDVTIGLLKQEKVAALNEDGSQTAFLLPANSSKSFDVVFVGEFAGTNRKHDKLLPEIIIEIAE